MVLLLIALTLTAVGWPAFAAVAVVLSLLGLLGLLALRGGPASRGAGKVATTPPAEPDAEAKRGPDAEAMTSAQAQAEPGADSRAEAGGELRATTGAQAGAETAVGARAAHDRVRGSRRRAGWRFALAAACTAVAVYGYGLSRTTLLLITDADDRCSIAGSHGDWRPATQGWWPLRDTACGDDLVPSFVNPLVSVAVLVCVGLMVALLTGRRSATR
ncbi:hypothetical protein [Actinoplanes sp. DH11]|uniref:hypothetical protein n=1 Tax=Actinoplanes sp. DH11 TaxID=2857011 RepID=UPI001E33EA2D|nr:hypothetical protein [Actinoplanes sp. DH11]